MSRDIDRIVVHCAATKPSQNIGVAKIREWHVQERRWSDVGYHYVIKRDGTIQLGRPLERPGAHAKGYNKNSVGICLVGGLNAKGKAVDNYTAAQMASLYLVVAGLKRNFPGAKVCGHNDLTKSKTCPNFDVPAWWEGCP